jgi:hypothetical protein
MTQAEIRVDENVPIPPRRQHFYPWAKMKVGDSFFAPRRTAALAGQIARKTTMVFTGRNVTENGVRGARIWRVK